MSDSSSELPQSKRQKTGEAVNVMNIEGITTHIKEDPHDDSEKQDLEKIEQEFTQLKEKFFADKIELVKEEIERLTSGTHQGLSNEIESLQSKKRKKLILADLLRKYQFQSISSFYDFEKKQAEDEFNSMTQEIQEKMLKSLMKRKKELEEEKRDFILNDHIPSDNQRVTTRTLRKRGGKDSADNNTTNFDTTKRLTGPEIRLSLTDDEIEQDYLAIQRVR